MLNNGVNFYNPSSDDCYFGVYYKKYDSFTGFSMVCLDVSLQEKVSLVSLVF